jgi:hypothetical protein
VDAWFDEFDGSSVGVADLYALAKKLDKFLSVLGRENEASQQIRLGRALGARSGQIAGQFRIDQVRKDHSGRYGYRLWPRWRSGGGCCSQMT